MRILLIVHDNEKFINGFPIGLGYIASVLLKNHYDVEIYNQDMHHYPDNHLKYYLDNNKFDIIGIGFVAGYYEYRKILSLSMAINSSKNRPFYIIAGHGPSPEPEFFLKKTKADAVVIGEGEVTILNLLNALNHKKSLKNVKGIAYKDGNEVIINERQPLIKNIDDLPFPAYHKFPMHFYRLNRRGQRIKNTDFVGWMISGRGCKFNCNFCYRMDKGFRPRSNQSIIEEIKYLQKDYGISYIIFQDELLMSSETRTISLCEDILRSNISVKWNCNGRLNYAKREVLKLMKKAGCICINYGVESFDDTVLVKMNKGLTTTQIEAGIQLTLEYDIIAKF